jgi:hypothetical protein
MIFKTDSQVVENMVELVGMNRRPHRCERWRLPNYLFCLPHLAAQYGPLRSNSEPARLGVASNLGPKERDPSVAGSRSLFMMSSLLARNPKRMTGMRVLATNAPPLAVFLNPPGKLSGNVMSRAFDDGHLGKRPDDDEPLYSFFKRHVF